jgi:hypothetical protein
LLGLNLPQEKQKEAPRLSFELAQSGESSRRWKDGRWKIKRKD